MSSCGRKEDSIWQYFHKSVTPGKAGCRATCRSCPKEVQGIPSRLRLHLTQCTDVVNNPSPLNRWIYTKIIPKYTKIILIFTKE